MNKERYYSGDDFAGCLARMEAVDRVGFQRRYDATTIPPSLTAELSTRTGRVYIYAAVEGWCGDCRVNVPLLARLVEAVPELDMRCHGKDISADLQVERIPTFIFYDEFFAEFGRWVERPASLVEVLRSGTPDEQREARRSYNSGALYGETLAEIAGILARRAF
jgi:hypothetical protein